MGFTNSPLVEYTRISPNRNEGRWDWTDPNNPKPGATISKVIIHHWAGKGTLEQFGELVANPARGMSANYAIDKDARVGMFCEEKDRSWCSNSRLYDNVAVTIEVSNSKVGEPWPISDKVLAKLIQLCADICKRNGIPKLVFTGDLTGSLVYHYMTANTSCFDPTITELLTPHGWKYLKDIEIGDLVACAHIDNLDLSFDPVLNKVPEYVHDTWKVRDIETTANHRMLVYSSSGHQSVCEMKDFMHVTSPTYIPNAGYMNNTKGLGHLSQSDIEFLVAIQADGHYMRDGDKYYGIEFHLAKERKIKRLKKLFSRFDVEYKETHQKDGTTKLRLYGKRFVDNAEMYLDNKCFTWEWLKLSPQQAEWLFDSILEYDGCRANNSYSSCDRINVDVVQALASIHGIGTKFYVEDRGKKNRRTSYRVYFKKPMRSRGTDVPKRKPKRTVSCVTVSTGFILVRQHGRTTIIGNCPETYIRSKTQYICDEVNKILNPPKPTNNTNNTNNTNTTKTTVKVGDLVSIKNGATYYNGGTIPSWVLSDKWYISSVSGDRAVLGKSATSKLNIQSPIKTSFLTVVSTTNSNTTNTSSSNKTQTISLNASDVIYESAGGKAKSTVGSKGVYTITETKNVNGTVYGKLKSGAGWIIVSGNAPTNDIVKGSIVSVTNPIIYGTNKKFTVLVKQYTVLSVSGDRCVISSDGKNVTAAIAKKYLKKIK